jgi:hypothetical protein
MRLRVDEEEESRRERQSSERSWKNEWQSVEERFGIEGKVQQAQDKLVRALPL